MAQPSLFEATHATVNRLEASGRLPVDQAELLKQALYSLEGKQPKYRSFALANQQARSKGRVKTRSRAKRQLGQQEGNAERAGAAEQGGSLWGEDLPGPVAAALANALEANKDAACARMVCRSWAR